MPRPLRQASLLATLLIACVAVATAPREREAWYAISDGDLRYGYLSVAARPTSAGGMEYALTSRVQLEVLGTPQELRTQGTLVAARDLAPLRLEALVETLSGRTHVVGRSVAEAFIVETSSDGETRTTAIPLAGPVLLFDVALGDWLHRRRSRGGGDAPPVVRLLDATGNVTLARLRPLEQAGDGSTWELSTEEMPFPSTLRFDGDGVLTEQLSRLPAVRVERCPAELARSIERRTIPERELLFLPLDRELPPSSRLQRLTVQLTWEGIPPGEFDLEDSRQRLESLAVDGERHTAVVVLQRPGEPAGDARRPLPPQELEVLLGESDFIRPAHPRIVATAREIVGEERSAIAAVTALSGWVRDHVRDEMIAETLSGPEVLERGVGKCTEYSTLFASLARAAGIPTRVALGLRLLGGTWGGHMWNEVHLGEWFPVDASVGEVGGSPALLKLVHSDTVAGTQPLRWKLIESLQVSVVGFESTPAAPGSTGLVDGVYTNVEHGFRLALPSPEWRVESRSEPGALVLRLRPPEADLGDGAMFHLVLFSLPAGTPPAAVLDARMEVHSGQLEELEVLADEVTTVAGAPGRRIEFRGQPPAEGAAPVHVTEVVWSAGGTGCLLNLIGTDALHGEYAQELEGLQTAFEFLGG